MRNLLLLLLVALATSSCATVVHGRFQQVPVTSDPAGAAVQVDCGSGAHANGVTPTTVSLRRGAEKCAITFTKEGYADRRVEFTRIMSGATFLNLLPGFAVGAVVGVAATEGSLLDPNNDSNQGNVGFATGLVAGTGAGMLIDRSTGAIYRQVPSRVDVSLTRR